MSWINIVSRAVECAIILMIYREEEGDPEYHIVQQYHLWTTTALPHKRFQYLLGAQFLRSSYPFAVVEYDVIVCYKRCHSVTQNVEVDSLPRPKSSPLTGMAEATGSDRRHVCHRPWICREPGVLPPITKQHMHLLRFEPLRPQFSPSRYELHDLYPTPGGV